MRSRRPFTEAVVCASHATVVGRDRATCHGAGMRRHGPQHQGGPRSEATADAKTPSVNEAFTARLTDNEKIVPTENQPAVVAMG